MPEVERPIRTFRELRIASGLTQLETAYRLGVSLSTVAALDRRGQEPGVLLAQKVADLFGVPVDTIAWEKIDPKKTPQAA